MMKQFALCDLGGVGKTEIASEWVLRRRDRFDAIFWVRVDEIAKLDHAFSQIAVTLGLEEAMDSKSHIVSRKLVKGWLSKPFKSKTSNEEATWLIVFDNANDPWKLVDYWPIQSGGSVLITSRDPHAKSIFSSEPNGIDLDPFTASEAGELLRELTHDADKDCVALKIAETLGGLPLAITQMAGIVKRQQLRLSEFYDAYLEQFNHAVFHGLRYGPGQPSYAHTISTVWVFESLGAEAKALLDVLSFLDPDGIEEFILRTVHPKSSFPIFLKQIWLTSLPERSYTKHL